MRFIIAVIFLALAGLAFATTYSYGNSEATRIKNDGFRYLTTVPLPYTTGTAVSLSTVANASTPLQGAVTATASQYIEFAFYLDNTGTAGTVYYSPCSGTATPATWAQGVPVATGASSGFQTGWGFFDRLWYKCSAATASGELILLGR